MSFFRKNIISSTSSSIKNVNLNSSLSGTSSRKAIPTSFIQVSTPDPISNIRLIRIKPNLSSHYELSNLEKRWITHRQKIQEWHHKYWKEHNTKFLQEKEEFQAQIKSSQGGRNPTPEEWSQFYKRYLEANFEKHSSYNRMLWFENVKMLPLGIAAESLTILRTLSPTPLDATWHVRVGQRIRFWIMWPFRPRSVQVYNALGVTVR